ncbi:hypothetical protein EPA93_10195 [Ktedonosporobacter rubrisoli]|uniref:Uncharacterized protein n=1 Tax=Ktedonosporobacter rubrisoli TaxID=2509675 RepID=A0A4P6JM87_KTERU|nr:hypothetical protein [Ktedonosporobacter rubrisoli]QBD76358.1 hypothetical protein EPA93_10195 [Ktedonosporobacter rubrisoli]
MISLEDLRAWAEQELEQAQQSSTCVHSETYLTALAAIAEVSGRRGDANDVLLALVQWARARGEMKNAAFIKIRQKIQASCSWVIWRRKREMYVPLGEEGIFNSLYEAWNRTYELWEQTGGHYLVALEGGRFEREMLVRSETGGVW